MILARRLPSITRLFPATRSLHARNSFATHIYHPAEMTAATWHRMVRPARQRIARDRSPPNYRSCGAVDILCCVESTHDDDGGDDDDDDGISGSYTAILEGDV
jgi:hypothetical protein